MTRFARVKIINILLFFFFLVDWFLFTPEERQVSTGVYWIVLMLFMNIATRKEWHEDPADRDN
jgi:L-asparagine transporter-like permease